MSANDGALILSDGKVEVRLANILTINVDAVVNAANPRLSGGSGVNGAIQRAAGPQLLNETRRLYPRGCPTGDAVITRSFNMANCDWIVHAVGPRYSGQPAERLNQERQLEGCYRRSLELAVASGARSIAFPTISTGIYRFPNARASELAMGAVRDFLNGPQGSIDRVVFLISGDIDENEYRQRFR